MISRVGFGFLAVMCAVTLSAFGSHPHYPEQQPWSPTQHGYELVQEEEEMDENDIPCTCGVFLESQTVGRGAALIRGQETKSIFSYPIGETLVEDIPEGPRGRKICTKKCVDEAIKFIHTGPQLFCSYVGKDVTNEKVHLFIKNKEDAWYPTKLNSGKGFTCRNGQLVK